MDFPGLNLDLDLNLILNTPFNLSPLIVKTFTIYKCVNKKVKPVNNTLTNSTVFKGNINWKKDKFKAVKEKM